MTNGRTKRKSAAIAVGSLVPGLIEPSARAHGFLNSELVARWREIAGPEIADVTRPERLKRGRDGAILTLRVTPGAHLDMSYSLDLIRERIDAAFGRGSVARITLIAGDIASQPAPSIPRRREASPPADLTERLDRIADPGLRAMLARLGGYRL